MTQPNLLPRSTPEAQGIASSALLAFVEAADRQIRDLHGLILLRHGHRVAQGWWSPYGPEHPHMLFSLSKSFTSTAVGLAVAEGRFSVDDPVLSFFPEDAPAEVSDHLAAMRVRHLLSMVTGHAEDTTGPMTECEDGNWVRAFLARPVEHEPGTHFLYNTGASYVLSAIVQKLTGMTVLDYLGPRLFAPLGIEDAEWGTCPRGINLGGFGLSVKTEDVARFGQMVLQKGLWQGQRILPAAWVEEATARQVSNAPNENPDWEQGYGYQFWRCRHGAYRGDGAFGQFCLVMPEQDAVLAITAGVGNMQAVLDLVWAHLLPAMGPAPLPENAAAHEALERKLAALSIPPQEGEPTSDLTGQVSGVTYRFPQGENEGSLQAISLDLTGEDAALTLCDERGEHHISVGSGDWVLGTTAFDAAISRSAPAAVQRPVGASGAWTAGDTYAVRLCFYGTPFCPTIALRFSGDKVTYGFKINVAFGPLERPELVGKAG